MENIHTFPIRETTEVTKKWNKIILCHTSRNIDEYLISLKYRQDGKYEKIPHYLVDRNGRILNTLETKYKSNFFLSENINDHSIIVCLENLGWLEKKPLKDVYVNWLGNIYKGEVFNKSWRDYNIWEPYTDIQLENTAKLCNKLCGELGINKECIGTNTKIKGSDKFKGIITRSNIYSQLTDLSPAFDFQKFEKYLENEQ